MKVSLLKRFRSKQLDEFREKYLAFFPQFPYLLRPASLC